MVSMVRMGARRTKADGRGMMEDVVARLKDFIESEMRSCSMDVGGITPVYVQRAWGGRVAIEDITQGLAELRKQGSLLRCGNV